jgi:site-specific recombinase XerD
VLTTLEGMPLTSREKNRNGPSRVYHLVQAAATKAGIKRDVHPHLFRHTFATEYLRANPKQIETLRDLLGHASYTQVRAYLHFVERQQRLEMVGTLPDTLL